MSTPTRYVAPVHFEDFSGEAFERLVFAYHLRAEWWQDLEWYGQVGSDSGRDIWGSRNNDFGHNETVCIQCVNRTRLTKTKAQSDVRKIIRAPHGTPTILRFVCRSDISADLRDAIKEFASKNSISRLDVWSGQEFEERLRMCAESLLQRFCDGVVFPEASRDLGQFVHDLAPTDDHEIIGRLSLIFDRPSFTTPFHSESSVGDFRQAISDTIEALNTGIRRLRDGTVFAKIHCRHDLHDEAAKRALADVVEKLNRLRMAYDDLERRGEIENCSSGSHLHIKPHACQRMDALRAEILNQMRYVYPQFTVTLKNMY
ncbi:MAG TPA: hypothetical protein V6C86_09625 [Oculatellaceae cyanobacterium]